MMGTVQLFEDNGSRSLAGRLSEIRDDGFHAFHDDPWLTPGTEVRFTYRFSLGRARVLWRRIADGTVENRYLILDRRSGQ